MTAKRLLVIDDQPHIGEFIRKAAVGQGFDVEVTTDAQTFKEKYASFEPDVIILDVVMPQEDGIELIRYLAGKDCSARLIIVSGYNSLYLKTSRVLAEDLGLPSVMALAKPIELEALEAALHG